MKKTTIWLLRLSALLVIFVAFQYYRSAEIVPGHNINSEEQLNPPSIPHTQFPG